MQETIVAVIILCACFSVANRYLPYALRASMMARAARTARRCGWNALADKLALDLSTTCASGCSKCGACAAPTAPTAKSLVDKQTVISLKDLRRGIS